MDAVTYAFGCVTGAFAFWLVTRKKRPPASPREAEIAALILRAEAFEAQARMSIGKGHGAHAEWCAEEATKMWGRARELDRAPLVLELVKPLKATQ